MKRRLSIRAQNALWIVPLFLVLSGVSAWASYKAIKQDLMWSFEEEARSLATAISELVDRDALAALVAGGEEHGEGIAAPIKRLRRWGHLHRLSIYDPEGALVASYGGLQSVTEAHLELSGEQRVAVLGSDRRSVWVQDIREFIPEGLVGRWWRKLKRLAGREPVEEDRIAGGGPEGALLSAFAPAIRRYQGPVVDGLSGCRLPAGVRAVEVPEGEVVAWVRVETHIDDFVAQVGTFQRKVLFQVLSSCLLGLLVVALLTRIVAPKLRGLAQAVEQVGTGRFGHDLEEGSVREINDLANTFGTMVSVLRETVEKGRRWVMDREESRATSEIADTWARQHLVPRTLRVDGFELAAMLGSEAPGSSFVALLGRPGEAEGDEPSGFLGVIGRVEGDDPVELAALSTAVPRFLEEHLEAFTPDRLLAEARRAFGVAEAKLVSWGAGDDAVLHLTLGGDGRIESRELRPDELMETGLLVQEQPGPSGDETLATLTAWVAPFDAEGFLTHLQRLVAGARRGGALFIRARAPGAG